eukprot:CAMPEP_0175833546 /NCGR_PEP_ID=MMETSP0107_2-20121207/15569_1 /TAXON_ID=195067 ORGANISM="Goniomonas pacifica, Strain CCMP1869" /NCGR_SAMPLE_ID=MMETSP0107_2 /ASSEMBLY_ACC=CAM_ASM_000203 /LENGTH=182 /DNA_ID=CAMNT_0017146685 /DNA_START=374 /DNA_END=922 /DNA_ORIENTATION=-
MVPNVRKEVRSKRSKGVSSGEQCTELASVNAVLSADKMHRQHRNSTAPGRDCVHVSRSVEVANEEFILADAVQNHGTGVALWEHECTDRGKPILNEVEENSWRSSMHSEIPPFRLFHDGFCIFGCTWKSTRCTHLRRMAAQRHTGFGGINGAQARCRRFIGCCLLRVQLWVVVCQSWQKRKS